MNSRTEIKKTIEAFFEALLVLETIIVDSAVLYISALTDILLRYYLKL